MRRLLFILAITLCGAVCFGNDTYASTNEIAHYDHTILKEPAYQSTPKYCLLTLGDRGDTKVWMVEDGNRLYVDKNADGDLADDGPPIEPSNNRHLDANRWDYNYRLDAITPSNGPGATQFELRRWNYGNKEDSYGLSLSVDGKMPMYAGWFGTFWSTNPATAPVIHFGGPFTPELLRRSAFTVGEKNLRLSLCFVHPGSESGAVSRLSIDALPRSDVPVLNIEWPTAAGSAPLRKSYPLTERCCYWEFYTTDFEVPAGVVPGKAKVTVDLLNFTTPIELTTTEIKEPVVATMQEADYTP